MSSFCYNDNDMYHHGVKGQKWGVHNGPPYPIREKTSKPGIVKTTISGHDSAPKQGIPNSITDHIGKDGKVDKRSFYGEDGWKEYDIHTTNHGKPKAHPFGKNGEHLKIYDWDKESGKLNNSRNTEIPDNMRKENEDIL